MTRTQLRHPLWTHAPALVCCLTTAVVFWAAWPLPDPAPVHFGAHGQPDRWGWPWEMPVVLLLVSLVAIGISIAVDETWARQERRKRFNWAALIDELIVGFLTGIAIDYVMTVSASPYRIQSAWLRNVFLMIAPVAAAAWLEILRPRQVNVSRGSDAEPGPPEEEVMTPVPEGERWAYWEAQNPRYTRWLLPLFGAGLVVLGLTSLDDSRWASAIALVMGTVVLLTCTGGFRVAITPQRLTLRGGLLGLPLFTVPVGDVTSVTVQEFSPLADFGGYGIRRNGDTLAFILEGTRGVRLTTSRRNVLIASERPERLAAVIRAATKKGRGN